MTFGLSAGCAIAIFFSIAAAQILLALALLALIVSKTPLRFPPVVLPLALFAGWTLLAVLASPDPAGGWPQIRKLILFGVLLAVYSGVRDRRSARMLLWGIVVAATASSLWSFVQFARKYAAAQAEGAPFYQYYLAQRTTGFMSHWMTFAGEMVMAAGIALALLFFAAKTNRERWWAAGTGAVIAIALVLNQTRGAWFAALAVVIYLTACWRPKWLLAIPVAAAIALVASPAAVRQRLLSVVRPHGTQDSNQHRIICWRTGLEMVRAHPVLGLGPERVGKEFLSYLPPDIPLPLPEGYYAHLHNVYLQYAAERGIPALLAILWLFGKMIVDWVRSLRAGGDRLLLHSGIAGILGTAIGGVTEYNLGNSEILHLLLAIAACAYAGLGDDAAGLSPEAPLAGDPSRPSLR